jgi:hypothetical protein
VATTLAALIDHDVVARELSRSDWIAALVRGGVSVSYAELVAELHEVFVSLLRQP